MKGGANMLNALEHAREVGCSVDVVHRTGELRISHPLYTKSIRVSASRKDAPRALTSMLRQIEARLLDLEAEEDQIEAT
jgi:molybdopterin synthase catalytic subunit